MPWQQPQYPVELTSQQEEQLIRIGRAHNSPQALALRARILVDASQHPEWSNQRIAASQHCTDRTVREWRKRWSLNQEIDDLPRPGCRRAFPP